jgi:hypothetical protein
MRLAFLLRTFVLVARIQDAIKESSHTKDLSIPDSKANIVVVFYSRNGPVEALAKAVRGGAREAGAEVRLRRVPDIVLSAVMAHVPGWEERSKRMLAE